MLKMARARHTKQSKEQHEPRTQNINQRQRMEKNIFDLPKTNISVIPILQEW